MFFLTIHTEEYMKKVTLAIAAVALLAISSEVNAASAGQRMKSGLTKLGTNVKAAGSAIANSSVGQAAGRAGKKVSAAAGAAKAKVMG